MYFEDLKQGTNKEIGPEDIFEKASNNVWEMAQEKGDNNYSWVIGKGIT